MGWENNKLRRRLTWFLTASFALILLALFAVRRPEPDVDTVSVGDPGTGSLAPDFEFELSPGKRTSLRALRGKAVLINFWASWCEPCMEEMASLASLEERLAGKPFMLLALDADEGNDSARADVANRAMPSHLIFDFSRSCLAAYDVNSIPVSVIVDRSGRVRERFLGPRDWTDEESLKLLEQAMRGP
jgi:thiol-disulfide isomerase/thioredoxin